MHFIKFIICFKQINNLWKIHFKNISFTFFKQIFLSLYLLQNVWHCFAFRWATKVNCSIFSNYKASYMSIATIMLMLAVLTACGVLLFVFFYFSCWEYMCAISRGVRHEPNKKKSRQKYKLSAISTGYYIQLNKSPNQFVINFSLFKTFKRKDIKLNFQLCPAIFCL